MDTWWPGRATSSCAAARMTHDLRSEYQRLPPLPKEESVVAHNGAKDKAWTFLGTYGAYASCYLARNNAAVAKVTLLGLLGRGSLTLAVAGGGQGLVIAAAAVFGMLDAMFLVTYTLGSFVLPPLLNMDQQSPWEIIAKSLAVVGCSQMVLCGAWQALVEDFGLTPLGLALLCCGLNGAAQSILFPSCKQLMADSFGADGAVLGMWNTCYYLGGIASTLLAAGLTDLINWQATYLGPGFVLIGFGIGGVISLSSSPTATDLEACGAKPSQEGPSDSTSSSGSRAVQAHPNGTLKEMLWPPDVQLRIVSGQYFAVKLVRYAFVLWLPVLLSFGHQDDAASSLLSVGGSAALFDAGSMAGSLALGALSKVLRPDALPFIIFCCITALALLLGQVPVFLGVAGSSYAAERGLLLALGVATGGGETLLGSISPIHCASKPASKISVASAVASVNGYGSLGTVIASILLPSLAGGNSNDLPGAFAALAPLCWIAAAGVLLQGLARSTL